MEKTLRTFTIDELIAKLQEIRVEEGNLPVAITDENDVYRTGINCYTGDLVWDDDPEEEPERYVLLEHH